MRPQPTGLVSSAVYALGDADRLGLLASIGKLGRIVEHEHGPNLIGIPKLIALVSQTLGPSTTSQDHGTDSYPDNAGPYYPHYAPTPRKVNPCS